ncbi:MAG: hypothetical protein ACXWN2_11360, partial [Candidatus Limnocylindrales bacterium]
MTGSDGHRGDLSELQRRGVATATEVFERLIEELDGVERRRLKADAGFRDSDDGGPADIPALRAAVARTIDVYADLFRRTLELYADVVESIARSTGPAPEPDRTGAQVFLAASPGTDAIATVWMHNATGAPVEDIALRMTDLTAHDGARIPASAAAFVPARVDVGPAASRSSSLAVHVPHSASDGTYVGHVLATGLPGTSLTVSLVVA